MTPRFQNENGEESSPLLSNHNATISSSFHNDDNNHKDNENITTTTTTTGGTASVMETAINVAKACMGTGCLALPYACQQGGIMVYIVGQGLIAVWNSYCMYLLVDCLQYIPSSARPKRTTTNSNTNANTTTNTNTTNTSTTRQDKENESTIELGMVQSTILTTTTTTTTPKPPPTGTGTLGIVAWYALGGTKGLIAVDVCQVILLFGIIVAYMEAILTFCKDIPWTLSPMGNAILTVIVMTSLSTPQNVGALSKTSAVGLFVLISTFIVIAIYGWYYPMDNNNNNNNTIIDNNNNNDSSVLLSSSSVSYHWYPSSLSSLSHWFGIVVFGYGVVPITYNFYDSMKEPSQLILPASAIAFSVAAVLYSLMGVGMYILFPSLSGDILQELPSGGWIATTTRITMTITILISAPLLIIPCAELLEGKLFSTRTTNTNTNTATRTNTTTTTTTPTWSWSCSSSWIALFLEKSLLLRIAMIAMCALCAVSLPGFVQVLSLVGCFCIATVGFCLPPLLHLQLLRQQQPAKQQQQQQQRRRQMIIDGLLLMWGIFTTIFSTVYVLRQMMSK